MKGYAKKDSVLQRGFEQEPAGSGGTSDSMGAFSPRRARFFTFALTQKEFVTAQQEYALARLIKNNDPVTRQQIIVQNLRRVVDLAKRYTDRGLDFIDLVREGNEGLIHALEQVEPEGDLPFSTFVDRCICQSIERAILDQYVATPERSFSFTNAAN